MQIIETDLLRVITPEKGYKLVNKHTNKYYNKVYLGINDSPDNYIEVVDDEYVDVQYKMEMNELKNKVNDNHDSNEMNMDVLLLSMAKVYEMVEPVLAMMPMTMSIERNVEDKVNPLVNMYVCIVKRGLMNIEDIPDVFKEDVMKLL